MLQKRPILNIQNVYTANAFKNPAGYFVGAGSETDPVVQLYNLAVDRIEGVEGGPGGMMSLLPVPGSSDSLISIMGLFPPFIGGEAGLFLHRKKSGKWNTVRAMELPFAHRCEFIRHEDRHYLVVATVSKLKENPADWSRPGEVHVISLEGIGNPPWTSEVIDTSMVRNHGMTRSTFDGKEAICISGERGIVGIVPGNDKRWHMVPLFDKEVSEMSFLDLDGDGERELITIEPFHGNTLNIYKRLDGDWVLMYSDTLSFGHGLSSGMFNREPVVVAGNRSDSLSLETFTVTNLSKGSVKREVIEEGAGPTQTQVFSFEGVDYILSANQRKHEVALYSVSPD